MQVFTQDGLLPMPHSLRGGGILAVTLGPEIDEVCDFVARTRGRNRDIQVLGFGSDPDGQLAQLSDVFIAVVRDSAEYLDPVLASDVEEQAIAQVLEAFALFADADHTGLPRHWSGAEMDFAEGEE